jgi:hypothetical protein
VNCVVVSPTELLGKPHRLPSAMNRREETMKNTLFLVGLFLSTALLHGPTLYAQTILTADGHTDTYSLINKAFGGTAEEVPDCSHPEFGPHITQSFDQTLRAYVFDFWIHVTPDNDRCTNFDRQRNEIKTNSDDLVALEGQTLQEHWLFRLDNGFQPSPNFTHIHQIKAIDGNAGAPLITLTPRAGNPNKLQLIATDDAGKSTTLVETDLAPFIGQWVEADEQGTFDWSGKYSILLRRASDGAVLLRYSSDSIQMWRTDTTRIRGKWGIYRSLDSANYLRDEVVLFGGFCVAKAPATCPSLSGPTAGAIPYTPTYTVQNRTNRGLNDVYGTFVDPSDNTLVTWTNVCAGEQRTELRWQTWAHQDTTNIEDYDMMFDSDTQRTAVSQVKSDTGGEAVYLQVTNPGVIREDNENHSLVEHIDGQWHHWTILYNPSTGEGQIWYDHALLEPVTHSTGFFDWYFKNGTYNNGLPTGHCSTAYFKNFKHFYRQ